MWTKIHTYYIHTQRKNDYTVLQYDKHVKLQWVDVVKLWFRIWTNAYGKEVGMSVKAGLTAEDVLGQKRFLKREREVKTVSCPMSEAWSAMSGLHSQRIEWEMLLNQLPCGHWDKMVS